MYWHAQVETWNVANLSLVNTNTTFSTGYKYTLCLKHFIPQHGRLVGLLENLAGYLWGMPYLRYLCILYCWMHLCCYMGEFDQCRLQFITCGVIKMIVAYLCLLSVVRNLEDTSQISWAEKKQHSRFWCFFKYIDLHIYTYIYIYIYIYIYLNLKSLKINPYDVQKSLERIHCVLLCLFWSMCLLLFF